MSVDRPNVVDAGHHGRLAARGDYSRQDMVYSNRLANRGYSVQMIFRALAQKPSGRRDPGSVKYMRLLSERGRDAADAYAQRTAERALAFVADNPSIKDRVGALVALFEIKAAADLLPWGCYGGSGARRALEAAFGVGEELGGVRFGLALRQWAEIAGAPFDEIRARRDRLVRMGWVSRNPEDRMGMTGRYTIRRPPYLVPTFTSLTVPHVGGEVNVGTLANPRDTLKHDAFRRRSLGDEGWYVVHCLSNPKTAPLDWLGITTGIRGEALAELVARLDRAGIVEVSGDSASLAPDLLERLDAAAEATGQQEPARPIASGTFVIAPPTESEEM